MPDKRRYRMGARAQKAAETRQRVFDAAIALFGAHAYEQVSLQDIASRAGVGLQTVVRIGASKDELFVTAARQIQLDVALRLAAVPNRGLVSTLEFLVDLYEEWGDPLIRMMAQEDRIPAVHELFQGGRRAQVLWIDARYGAQLDHLDAEERERRVVSLLVVTGARSWYVFRRVHGLSKTQIVLAMREMVEALVRVR